MIQNTNHWQHLKFNGLFVVFCLLLVSISCGTKELQSPEQKPVPTVLTLPDNTHFDIHFETEQINDQQFYLKTVLELDKGSYVISPFSEDTFYLHFNIFLDETDFFTLNEPLLEFPSSIIEFDTIIETPVRFVRTNTTYKQAINIKKQEDFETTGMVEFLIEPSCIPYQVDFALSYKSGTLSLQKTETRFHPSFKGK